MMRLDVSTDRPEALKCPSDSLLHTFSEGKKKRKKKTRVTLGSLCQMSAQRVDKSRVLVALFFLLLSVARVVFGVLGIRPEA